MKIGEAQQIYREQVRAYQQQKQVLSKQLTALRSDMDQTEDEAQRSAFSKEAAVLELSIGALNDRQKEYQDYLDDLTEQYCAQWNAVSSEQQADAYKEYAEDLGKIMEVARRIMRGATVPQSDEKKLMDFDSELYQMAKAVGEMAKRMKEEREEYDSLWKDEEKKEYEDPQEAAENATAAGTGPEIVSVEETLAGVSVPEE